MSEFRFILTQDCCFKCSFCHHEGIDNHREELLNATDYSMLFYVGHKFFNIEEATLTGGEPLCRKDVINIAQSLYYSGCKTTLTTNGYYLDNNIEIGKYLTCINVSLNSDNPNSYDKLVGVDDAFKIVTNNIGLFRSRFPYIPICLNVPLTDTITERQDCLEKIINIAERYHSTIKFIELYTDIYYGQMSRNKFEKLLIENDFIMVPSFSRASCYIRNNTVVRVTQIFCAYAKDKDNPSDFCHNFNDLFLTPDGKIKICRHSNYEIDLLPDVKTKDVFRLYRTLSHAFETLGMNCKFGP